VTLLITDGLPRGLGYFEVDQRNVEAELPVGIPRHFEADTYTCSHCNYVVVMNPARVRERYKCKGCNHHVCDGCAAKAIEGEACKTMLQKAYEHLERASRQPDPSPIIAVKE
jgi:hypothetical protein